MQILFPNPIKKIIMKIILYLSISFLLLNLSATAASIDSTETAHGKYPVRIVTIEPAIGVKPWPISDFIISNLVQWNIMKRLSIVSYTSYSFNSAFTREYNYIKTNYNYTLSQKFGVGTSLYTKNSSHTFSLIAGIKYDAFKETLENPAFEHVSASVSSVSPDVGLLYNLKLGKKKYFFSFRMYIPLYPYPFKSSDINAIDGNEANLTMEFGIGIRLK
jgi:hypothetical protein